MHLLTPVQEQSNAMMDLNVLYWLSLPVVLLIAGIVALVQKIRDR